MKLFINLTAKAFVTSATDATPLGALVVKQGDIDTLDLVLLEETGTVSAPFNVVDLPAGFTQIRLGARTKANVTETDLLFSATEFVESGTGDSRVFTADLVLDTTPIGDKFTDATTLSLEALLDVELLSADESVKRTVIDQWPTTVNRDIFRDTEGVPASGNPMLRAVWMPDITGLTGGTATDLDGLPTEGGVREFGALVMINEPSAPGIGIWQLVDTAVQRDVVGSEGITSAVMDSTGLVVGMSVTGAHFPEGTLIESITSPGAAATVGFSQEKTSSGTDTVTFRYTEAVMPSDSATQVVPDDFNPASLGGVWQREGIYQKTMALGNVRLSDSGLSGEREFTWPDTSPGGQHLTDTGVQTISGQKTFADGTLKLAGLSSGTSTIKAPATGGGTATLPGGSGTLAYLPAAGVKASDQTKTNDAAMANDTEMAITLTPGTYRITAFAIYANANGSSQAQGKLNFTGSYSAATGTLEAGLHTGAGIRGCYPNATDADLFAPTFSNTGQNQWYIVNGILVVTASGVLSWRWAQFSSSSNSITLKKGSAIIAQRL